jgi:hypothetical protein
MYTAVGGKFWLVLCERGTRRHFKIPVFGDYLKRQVSATRRSLVADDRGGTVPSQRYKEHLVISIARHDSITRSWLYKVNISWWENGKFHYRIIDGPSGVYQSEEEAVSGGFLAGQHWIDERLSTGVR